MKLNLLQHLQIRTKSVLGDEHILSLKYVILAVAEELSYPNLVP